MSLRSSTAWPGLAGLPSTVTRPAAIQASTWRREPIARAASNFWILSRIAGIRRGNRAPASDRRVGVVGRRQARRRGLHVDWAVEVQLDTDVVHVAQGGERRQIVKALEAEVIQELTRRAEQLRMTWNLAMPDDPNPPALGQRADDVGVHGYAANVLDLAPRDRLPVGDQGESLE